MSCRFQSSLVLAGAGLLSHRGSAALFKSDYLVGFQIFEDFFSSPGPEDFNAFDSCGVPDPEMQAQVVLGDVTVAAACFIHLLQPVGNYGDAGADSASIRFFPYELDQNPILPLAIIFQQA